MKKQNGFVSGAIVFALFILVIIGNAGGISMGKSAQIGQVQVSEAK